MTFWRFLGGLVFVYTMLLILRVILSWFQGAVSGKPWDLLVRVTDPYLALFSRFRFLRQGMFDFTPIAAILTLVVARNIILSIEIHGRITIGGFLAIVTGAIWSGLSFLLIMFIVLTVARVIILAVRSAQASRFAEVVGFVVEPVVSLARRIFSPQQPLSDRQYLYLTIVSLFAVLLLGQLFFGILIGFFGALPI